MMKVCCAIIEDNGKVLAAQRSEKMNPPLKWEFPGGKLMDGERPEDCIKREMMEEFSVDIDVVCRLEEQFYKHGDKKIELIPFVCKIKNGDLNCNEHKDMVWDNPESLSTLDWTDADVSVYEEYLGYVDGDVYNGT